MPRTKKITVYVNAWQYNSGAGFDWYRRPGDADAAFEKEKDNCDELKADGWSAYRFDVVVPASFSDEEITETIDADLDDLCVKAPQKQENILAEYGQVLSKIKPEARKTIWKAVGFCFTNKAGGTSTVTCTTAKLTQVQKLLARFREHRVKWVAEFICDKTWNDGEIGQQMIGTPVNKELKAFLKRHAHPDHQKVYVNRAELAAGEE